MFQNDKTFYDLIGQALVGATFQEFVDKFKAKYNELNTDGFDWDPEIQIDFTYQQLQAELGIAVLPQYVDINSPANYITPDEYSVGTNKIPRSKSGFAFGEDIMRKQLLAMQSMGVTAITEANRNVLLELLFNSTDRLLQGEVNKRTHQRMQVVSKGQFTIDATNNPRGIKGLTFDFGIPSANITSLTNTNRWWTNASHATEGSAADPLMDLRNMRKEAENKGVYAGHFEMSKELFEDMLFHSKVTQRVGLALYPTMSNSDAAIAAQNLLDDARKATIEKIVGARIVVRDAKAAVEKRAANGEIEKVMIDSFDKLNVAYVPDGELGTIKAVRPLVVPDPAARIAFFDGGRTVLKQRFDTEYNVQYIEIESTNLVVPNKAKYMFIKTVTA